MREQPKRTPPWSEFTSEMSPEERREFVLSRVEGMGLTPQDLRQAADDMKQKGQKPQGYAAMLDEFVEICRPFVWAPPGQVDEIVAEAHGKSKVAGDVTAE